MSKYDTWRRLFEVEPDTPFSFRFEELEHMLGGPLPASARRHKAWWAPSQMAAVWSDYGYRAKADLDREVVTFLRRQMEPHEQSIDIRSGSETSRIGVNELSDPAHYATRSTDEWHCVKEWNTALASEFFSGKWANRPVYLDLEEQTFHRLGHSLGSSGPDAERSLIACVRQTIHVGTSGVASFSSHVRRTRQWGRADRTDPPPCLALLAVFALAAEKMRADPEMASNNYRGRLAQLLEVNDQHQDKLYRDFMRQSHELWAALNSWIEEGEGVRGIPTAKAFDRRVHVGVPISQALIKEADRLRLWPMFARYQLEPGQNMAPRDMRRILTDWLPNSSVSPYVKHLWSQGSNEKSRIAEIATVELRAWGGQVRQTESRQTSGTLRLAGRMSRFPTRRLELWLVTDADLADTPGPFRPSHDSAQLAAVLGGEHSSVQVSEGLGRWAAVTGSDSLSIPDLMTVMIDLRGPNGVQIRRNPKAVLVMAHDDQYGFFVEQERAQLGRDSIILAYGTKADEVDEVLTDTARPGYARLNAGVEGLPEAWTAFVDIQLVSIPETDSPDLAPLVPLAWNEASFGDGFRMPGPQTWHRAHPPELRLSALDADKVGVELECTQRLDDNRLESRALGELDGSGVLDLQDQELVDGDYTVRLVAITATGLTGAAIITNNFRLRSGDYPRHVDSGGFSPARRELEADAGWAVVSAAHGANGDTRGADVRLPLSQVGDRDFPAIPKQLEVRLGAWTPEDDRGPAQHHQQRMATSANCAIGSGAHHWILPDYHPDNAQPKELKGQCKQCGVLKWFPRRPPTRSAQSSDKARIVESEFSGSRVDVEPIRQSSTVEHDILLDALSYARVGSWDSFTRLASQVNEAPWFPMEHATLLEALGHIELIRSPMGLGIEQWTVATPVLMALSDGRAVLSGRRSGRLLGVLTELADSLGGQVKPHPQQNGPTTIEVQGFGGADLVVLAELLSEEIEEVVRMVDDPSRKLAGYLPPLELVARSLSRFTALDAEVLRFSVHRNRWEPASDVTHPGAYRFLTRPVTYGAVLGDGDPELVHADNRWCKWFGGLAIGYTPLAYNDSERTLTVPLGARLPGMYERVAALSSGRPPTDFSDGTTRYHDVPADIANHLWSLLSVKDEPPRSSLEVR